MRRKRHFRYYDKQPVKTELYEKKYREFLLKDNYDRPPKTLQNLIFALSQTRCSYQDITNIDITYMLLLDAYEFFTLKHVMEFELGDKADKYREVRAKLTVYKLQRMGFVYKAIRNWDISDEEYKQRFGEDKNRHNYKRRYALTDAGREFVKRFYDLM